MKNVDIEAVIFRLSEIVTLKNLAIGFGLIVIAAAILFVST